MPRGGCRQPPTLRCPRSGLRVGRRHPGLAKCHSHRSDYGAGLLSRASSPGHRSRGPTRRGGRRPSATFPGRIFFGGDARLWLAQLFRSTQSATRDPPRSPIQRVLGAAGVLSPPVSVEAFLGFLPFSFHALGRPTANPPRGILPLLGPKHRSIPRPFRPLPRAPTGWT